MPTVPWPAITAGSSKGCTKVSPRRRFSLRAGVGVVVGVAEHDLGAERATASTLIGAS